ncbi:MAG: glucose 1-dehydrogenase [Sphingomonadaceae bacterium]|nr:glucose 1-dehydrogenase [Sphingomonadaceae bacterium]
MGVLDQFRLDGGAAVVTGGSRGIGKGIAIALAEAGADVVVAARRADSLAETVAEIGRLGRRVHGVACDVSRPEEVRRLADEAVAKLGKVTIWVNNAGGQPDMKVRPFVEVSHENFQAQVDLNLTSVWAGSVEAARILPPGGSLINISSSSARSNRNMTFALYGALKAALNNLTKTLAVELGPQIRVNAVAPGPVPTEALHNTLGVTAETEDEFLPMMNVPLQSWGTPADIGAAVVFMASPAARWITGECLFVTGGL